MSDKITICSVGDLMIADSPLFASVGIGSRYPAIRGALISAGRELFSQADIVIGNFETVVHEPRKKTLKEMQMACPASVLTDLRQMGFSILNIANNHCLQHGTTGFRNTQDACYENGIQPIGIRNEEPFFTETKGRCLAFLSLCIHLEWYQPDDILYEDDIARILHQVQSLKEKEPSTTIIVSVHWGDEYAMYPSNAQIALGHMLFDLGASVVLGHHSHVFQGAEKYRDGVILYSQGNFVSDMVAEMCRQTAVTTIELQDDTVTYTINTIRIGDDYVPVADEGAWLSHRNTLLQEAIGGAYTDDRYWEDIKRNHAVGHNAFKRYFKKNVLRYKPSVAARMIAEFLVRKCKRMAGTSTDGRVSSMDPMIMKTLNRENLW